MRDTVLLASALMIALLLLACGGRGDGSISDSAVVGDLTERLARENAQYYAFACADLDGMVFSADPSPDAIARDLGVEHAAGSWAAETIGVVLDGDDGPQYVIIHDPTSHATNAQEFEKREVASDGGTLTCFVPK